MRSLPAAALVAGLFWAGASYRVDAQGLINDDIVYYDSARTTLHALRWHSSGRTIPLGRYLSDHGVLAPESPWYAKPLWHLTTVSLLALFGEKDVHIVYINGLLGALILLMLIHLGARLFGREAALLGGVFSATLGQFFGLARSGMADVSCLFYFLLGLFCLAANLIQHRAWRQLLAGAVFGLSTMTHFLILPYLGGVLVFQAYHWLWDRRDIRGYVRSQLMLLFPFALVVFMVAWPFRWVRSNLAADLDPIYQSESTTPWQTVAEQFQHNLNKNTHGEGFYASRTFLQRWLQEHVYDLWVMEGGVKIILLTATLLLLPLYARKAQPDQKKLLLLIGCAAGPAAALYLSPLMVPGLRKLHPALAIGGIGIGALWKLALERDWLRPRLKAAAALTFLTLSAANALPALRVKSGVKETALWLKSKGVDQVAVLDMPTWGGRHLRTYGIQTVKVGDGGGWVFAQTWESFFEPLSNQGRTGRSLRWMSQRQPAFESADTPLLQAFDLSRRRLNPWMDPLVKLVLGRPFRRASLRDYLFRA